MLGRPTRAEPPSSSPPLDGQTLVCAESRCAVLRNLVRRVEDPAAALATPGGVFGQLPVVIKHFDLVTLELWHVLSSAVCAKFFAIVGKKTLFVGLVTLLDIVNRCKNR